MKKMLFSCVVLLFSITMLADELYINTAPADIKIRNKPTTSADMVGVLPVHQTISVVTLNGDWAIVRWNGGIGYVAAKYLTKYTEYQTDQTHYNQPYKYPDSAKVQISVNVPDVFIKVDKSKTISDATINEDSTYSYQPIMLHNGTHKLTFNAAAYRLKEQRISISKGQDAEFTYTLKKNPDWNLFLLANYEYGIKEKDHHFGLTLGMARRVGWYVSAMMGTGLHYKTEAQMDHFHCGVVNGKTPFYTGKTSKQYIAGTLGLMIRLGIPLYLTMGVGGAYNPVAWQTNNDSWIEYNGYANGGFLVESGLVGNIKGFTISAGCSVLMGSDNNDIYCRVGIGYTFPLKKMNERMIAKKTEKLRNKKG